MADVKISEKTDHIVPPGAPVPAEELPKVLPYGPVNGVEQGYEESDIYRADEDGNFTRVADSDRNKSGAERTEEPDKAKGEPPAEA